MHIRLSLNFVTGTCRFQGRWFDQYKKNIEPPWN